MDTVAGLNPSSPLFNLGTGSTINSTDALLASELSPSTSGLLSNASTIVELSAQSQFLSAATAFQDQLQSLQPGTANSAGGRNFGTDLTSLAAEVQNFVDAFNGLQSNLASIGSTGILLGGSIPAIPDLGQSLNTQVRASFTNGNSSLTNLSQLGIEFIPSSIPGGKSSLSINLGTLQSAFNTDASGAFSLLASAASSLGSLAEGFISQSGAVLPSLTSQAQLLANSSLLTDGLVVSSQTGSNLSNLLTIASLTGGGENLQQVVSAINEYTLVSTLFA